MDGAEESNTDTRDAARKLAGNGFHVFPLIQGGKIPAVGAWQHKATREPDKLWTKPDFNIGIACGKAFDGGFLLVLDVDVKGGKEGLITLASHEDRNSRLPDTFTVETASGGIHLYFTTPEPAATSAGKLGPGLDTRGAGGYVVAPFSVLESGAYRIKNKAKVAKAPEWLIALIGRPRERNNEQVIELLDMPAAIERATDYLKNTAPEAVQNANGDITTFKVAAAVADFGVAELTTLELMAEHWNPVKASPPWDYEELAIKVANAYRYRAKPVGERSPHADFEPVDGVPATDLVPTPKERQGIAYRPVEEFNESEIPPRKWLLGRVLLREKVTLMIAPPGVGKSTATLAWALSVITGRKDIAGLEAFETGNVLVINNEDDMDELKRRMAAVRRHGNVAWKDLKNRLFLYSGVERPFLIARRRQNSEGVKRGEDLADLMDMIRAHNIKLVVADPFLETHEADENDNRQVNEVARLYRELAVATGCAVCLVHHTRKVQGGSSEGHAGNMDSGRGASSLAGVARIIVTLYDMSRKDAEKYAIPEDNRHLYVRLDDAKANLSLKSPKARWYKKVTMRLANEDEVGVLEPVELKEAAATMEDEILEIIASDPEFAPLRDTTAMRVGSAAAILKNSALFSDMSKRTLERRLENSFTEPKENDAIKIWVETIHRDGKNILMLYCENLNEVVNSK